MVASLASPVAALTQNEYDDRPWFRDGRMRREERKGDEKVVTAAGRGQEARAGEPPVGPPRSMLVLP